mmetsp:Transcript_113276/g.366049  ORF Transcript_113276/g.366049 Transcript_113276/m.366049 type:complete len:442 (-) Transcript_113276:146-1471(-)
MTRESFASVAQFMKIAWRVPSSSSSLARATVVLALSFMRALRFANLEFWLVMSSSTSLAFFVALTSSLHAEKVMWITPVSLLPAILLRTPCALLLFSCMNFCILASCAFTCSSKPLFLLASSQAFIQACMHMVLRLSSLPEAMRIMDFFALSRWAALRLPIFALALSIWPLSSLSSFSSCTSLAQSRTHSPSSSLAEPSEFLMRTLRTFSTCACLYSISFFWASSISFWNFSWMSFSATYWTFHLNQALKTLVMSVFALLPAMLRSTPFAFLLCSWLKLPSRSFMRSSKALARSVSIWHWFRRAMRFPVLETQLSCTSLHSLTSKVASMIACLRIWELTPWSPSSMIRASSSGGPSSKAHLTREAADMTSCICSAKCSKALRTSPGIFETTHSIISSSSFLASSSLSSAVSFAPCSWKRSRAAAAQRSRSQSLARPEWSTL